MVYPGVSQPLQKNKYIAAKNIHGEPEMKSFFPKLIDILSPPLMFAL